MERSSGAAPPRRPGAGSQARGEGDLLTVEVERADDRFTVVALAGELDLSTIPRLEGPLLDEIREQRVVIADLTRLAFIDSSGIGLLIKAHRETEDGGALHTVVAPGSQVERVFTLVGIGIALPLHLSRDEAIAALDEQSA